MSRLWLQLAWIALLLLGAATAASAQTVVNFNSLDGTTKLTAHLSRPEGDAPRPAVVLMHGCSGLLDGKGRILGLYRAWARPLVVQGYVTLTVDSASSRGFGRTCSATPNRITRVPVRVAIWFADCVDLSAVENASKKESLI